MIAFFFRSAGSNLGIARYRNRKAERAAEPNRFSTQPITVNELKGMKPSSDVTTSASETNLGHPGTAPYFKMSYQCLCVFKCNVACYFLFLFLNFRFLVFDFLFTLLSSNCFSPMTTF